MYSLTHVPVHVHQIENKGPLKREPNYEEVPVPVADMVTTDEEPSTCSRFKHQREFLVWLGDMPLKIPSPMFYTSLVIEVQCDEVLYEHW